MREQLWPYDDAPECRHCFSQQAVRLNCGCWVCFACGEPWDVEPCKRPDCDYENAYRYEEWALRADGTARGQ